MDGQPKVVTVESIREELRSAMFWCSFGATACAIEQRTQSQEIAIASARNMVIFGVNSGLLEMEEAREWEGGIIKNEPPIGATWVKYGKKPEPKTQDGPTSYPLPIQM